MSKLKPKSSSTFVTLKTLSIMYYFKSVVIILLGVLSLNSCAQKATIVGVWEVKNDYYEAVYEIVEQDSKFFGKVHYYNDGTTTYEGKNEEEDYFLKDIEYKDGKYMNGKMYMPNGSFYQVNFTLRDKNTLQALMTVEEQPYTEIWTRSTTD